MAMGGMKTKKYAISPSVIHKWLNSPDANCGAVFAKGIAVFNLIFGQIHSLRKSKFQFVESLNH
jgi:hypothetical protein